MITIAENRHKERYTVLAKNLGDGLVFKRPGKVRWVCRNCGYIHEGTEATKVCPLCKHPQGYYELEAAELLRTYRQPPISKIGDLLIGTISSLLYPDDERGKEARPGLVPETGIKPGRIPVVVGEVNYV